jgi:hypothetical protein
MHYLLLFLALFLGSCSSKENQARKQNLKGEYLYRLQNEYFFNPPPPLPQSPEKYPWEGRYIGEMARITKEFFRCKGSSLNPSRLQTREGKEPVKHYDCQGGKKHGLPLRNGKEFVYPCLLELLNSIQQKTGKRVVITCGHRCPKHNIYVDPTPYNWSSKHMLGAEVDFYVEGMEKDPTAIVSLIQEYYLETPPFSNASAFTTFHRYEKEGVNVSTPPWYNKEVFIKLYLEHEGRNCDNPHPYPYLSIQVRHDRDLDAKVVFDQKQAQNYLRH